MGRRKWVTVLLLGTLCLTGCGKVQEPPQPEAEWTLVQEVAAVLSDGEQVGLWQSDNSGCDFYKLSDGTDLLLVYDTAGPDNVVVANTEGFQDLGETARWNIRSYYEQQGLLYDVQEELEKAYDEYKACQASGEAYQERSVRQEITPTASSERMMCFLTLVTLPEDSHMMRETRLGAVFDRETGEQIDLWSMFSVPQETAMERLLEAGEITEPALYAEMAAAIQPERVIFFKDYLELSFPEEALSGMEGEYIMTIDYSSLSDVLEDWAVPDNAP